MADIVADINADITADPMLSLVGLVARFGEVHAVDRLDLDLPAGSFTALLGPSGCGKSTTLAMIAGLLDPTAGDVVLDGRSITTVAPERRPISLVFQKPLLFPHLTVDQNVGFGLRMRHVPRRDVRRRVTEMLERVRLAGLGGRRVGELSGGQEQRVALARALVLTPRVLLLDEPFSQLDADLRAEMRALLRELHDASDLTTLFVTHDLDEAVELADRIALMLDGSLAGLGTPASFYLAPPTLVAARFFGSTNELRGQVRAGRFSTCDGAVVLDGALPDGPAVLVVRPEAVALGGMLSARVTATRFAGTHVVVDTELADGQSVRVHADVGARLAVGDRLDLSLPPGRCTVFAVDQERQVHPT